MRWPWQRDEDEDDIARSATSARDARLSEYLDGVLPRPERAAVEAEAERDADLRVALEGMRAVRAGLGGLGLSPAPRSFAVAPHVVPRQRGVPQLEFYARLGAAVAALALTVISVAPSLTGGAQREEATSAESRLAAPQTAQDAASPTDARKQAAEAPAPPAGARPAPAVAPALEGAASGGATSQAPAVPQAPQSFGATANSAAPGTPSPGAVAPAGATTPVAAPLPPVELGRSDDSDAVLTLARIGLATAMALLATFAFVLWARRRAAFR